MLKTTLPNGLPPLFFPVVGREAEVKALISLLRTPDVRLLTVTGTGGVGKTCLAIHVASQLLDDFADGLAFVSLASISDPQLVIPAIAQSLGIMDSGDESLLMLVKKYLHEKHFLLLLDNFEQVLDAAPQLGEIIAACAGLKVLLTSRESLRLYGEREFPLSPLTVPDLRTLRDPTTVLAFPCVQLFLSRVQAIQPTFTIDDQTVAVVAEICVRLDGVPLALELAAARSKVLPPATLLSYLAEAHALNLLASTMRDTPARQRTLHNTIAWSYQLLSPPEQNLFRQLAVFVGGCSLDAAAIISRESKDQLLDKLQSLLDKHLLRRPEQNILRFTMLETIRQYALEQLSNTRELDASYRSHAAYYVALAESAELKLAGAEQGQWLDTLQLEHDNLRAALERSLSLGYNDLAIRLGAALWRFWFVRGYQTEGRHWLDQVLKIRHGDHIPAYGKVLAGAATLALYQSDYHSATAFYEQGLGFYRSLSDPRGISAMLNGLAHVNSYQGRYDKAKAYADESVALERTRAVSDGRAPLAFALFFLGFVAWQARDYELANRAASESLAIFEEVGDHWGAAFALQGLGHTAVSQRGYQQAQAYFTEALETLRALGDRRSTAMCLIGLGYIALDQHDPVAARDLQHSALSILSEFGDNWFGTLAWEGMAEILLELDDAPHAVQLLSLATRLRDAIGAPLPLSREAAFERTLMLARKALGEVAFERAWAQGRTLDPDQALVSDEVSAPTVVVSAENREGLSGRELDVLRLVAQGLTDAQIAARLIISSRTVGSHLRSIYGKLAANSRSAATRYALEHHLV